jgi:hypothetical protein
VTHHLRKILDQRTLTGGFYGNYLISRDFESLIRLMVEVNPHLRLQSCGKALQHRYFDVPQPKPVATPREYCTLESISREQALTCPVLSIVLCFDSTSKSRYCSEITIENTDVERQERSTFDSKKEGTDWVHRLPRRERTNPQSSSYVPSVSSFHLELHLN